MTNENNNGGCAAGVKTFVRNRYFYGKLLDVLHFDSSRITSIPSDGCSTGWLSATVWSAASTCKWAKTARA